MNEAKNFWKQYKIFAAEYMLDVEGYKNCVQ